MTLGIAYTYSKTLTNESSDRGVPATEDTYNPGLDYGPASLNQPQTFVANYVYQLPFFQEQHGLEGHLLGGWELSGITQFFSGQSQTISQPLDPFDCQTPAGATSGCIAGTYPGGINIDINADLPPRPDKMASVRLPKTQAAWFTTASFADAVGHFGSSSTGILLGPGLELWDLSAIKNVAIGERLKFQFRAEFFNAFNHTNFNAIGTETDTSTYGQVISTHDPREIQFGGKLTF